MRRNKDLAEDYARRHHIERWYSEVELLLQDPKVNAVYIATPPSSHKELTIRALSA